MKRQHGRKKELTEVQALKYANKNLRAENSTLKRKLKKLERTEHFHEWVEPYEDDEEVSYVEKIDKTNICPSCNKGLLVETYVVGRYWVSCDQCDFDSRKVK